VRVDELADSASLVNDQSGLRRRLAEDGYPPELFSRLFSGQRWWEPVPAGLALRPRTQMAAIPPGPSRLVAVHPGWKHWRPPPPAAVH